MLLLECFEIQLDVIGVGTGVVMKPMKKAMLLDIPHMRFSFNLFLNSNLHKFLIPWFEDLRLSVSLS